MNADSDTSKVVADGGDSCVSPGLKVSVCIGCYVYFGAIDYCAKYV